MSDPAHSPCPTLAAAIAGVAAGLYPTLSPAERLDLALRSLGLTPLAPWADGRMVYVAAAGAD